METVRFCLGLTLSLKYRNIQFVLLFAALTISLTDVANGAFRGDVNQDDDVDLQDVIVGLQILTGNPQTLPEFDNDIDVDRDDKIGLAEIMYTLNAVANNNIVLRHQAMITGPLSGAGIAAYRVEDLSTIVEGTKKANTSINDLQIAGTFDISLPGVAGDEWILVTAAGGEDIDADGDGVADTVATENSGTLHALAKASDWRTKNIKISPLTELVWRFTENLIPDIPADELEIRLADLARHLIQSDIDGSGEIDWHDFLVFDPSNPTHRDCLATSYDWLSTVNDEGHSLIGSLLAGDTEQMLSLMDEIYTWLMTRFPIPDSRFDSVKLSLSVFGSGSASSGSPYTLSVDSTLAEPVYQDHVFLTQNESTSVTFTAVAGTGAQILGWSGCETVSADLSQCTVSLDRSRSVVANFGSTTTELKGTVHDLSRTGNILSADAITVKIPADMTDMITEMPSAAVDDFVVGDDDGGFLRRITEIIQVNPTYYLLKTTNANLDEVIAEGTGYLFKRMENSDLDGYVPATAGMSASVSPQAFTGLDGVRLVASDNPGDRTFTISLGESSQDSAVDMAMAPTISGGVVLYDDGQGGQLSASGSIELDISLDTGINFTSSYGLKDFKFITILDSTGEIALTATTELAALKRTIKIGTLTFNPIVFLVGLVPVWVSPTVDISYFSEGKIEVQLTAGLKFKEVIEGGVLYNQITGFSIHKDHVLKIAPKLPSVDVSASLKGGIEAKSALKIYSATGPAIPLQAYLKLNSTLSTVVQNGCQSMRVTFLLGAEASFKWDMSGGSKFGQMLHLDQLEDKTTAFVFTSEWKIKEWSFPSTCPVQPPLLVEGNGISGHIDEGDPNGLETTMTLSNSGDEFLEWNTSDIPAEATVTPSSGILAPRGEESVQIMVGTAELPVGRYLKRLFFYDEASVGTGLPDTQFGNTFKTIDITVNGTITDTPSSIMATSSEVGTVVLNWSFTPSGYDPFVGFQVYATDTPADESSYQQVHTTSIHERQAVISGFSPGSTQTFKLRAFSSNGADPGPFSAIASVTVAGGVVSTVESAGQVWMDRNLGASQVATSATDSAAYGDYYQWGRLPDGHEKQTSWPTMTLSTSDVPGHGMFISSHDNTVWYDWRTPQNNDLWQGVSGINNPCPAGFRLPTTLEWDTERQSWSSDDAAGAFSSPLKLVLAGGRWFYDASMANSGIMGFYWSRRAMLAPYRLRIETDSAFMDTAYRSWGCSVRCIKD